MTERWHLTGQVIVTCNCDWGCPCNFNALPTQGKCEGGWTWPKIHGPYSASYDVLFDSMNTRMKIGEYVEIECGPIRNPVTGNESHPGVVLPQGIIFKRGDLGTTTRFRVSNGIEYDHSGKYMGVGPFDYAWP